MIGKSASGLTGGTGLTSSFTKPRALSEQRQTRHARNPSRSRLVSQGGRHTRCKLRCFKRRFLTAPPRKRNPLTIGTLRYSFSDYEQSIEARSISTTR